MKLTAMHRWEEALIKSWCYLQFLRSFRWFEASARLKIVQIYITSYELRDI